MGEINYVVLSLISSINKHITTHNVRQGKIQGGRSGFIIDHTPIIHP